MLVYTVRRILILIPLLFVISVITFVLIQLPPGDYLTLYIMQLEAAGTTVAEEEVEMLKRVFGLDKPMHVQYFIWLRRILIYHDFGRSFQFQAPVSELLADRVPLTVAVSLATTVFVFVVAVPIGILSATNQYSLLDYFWTFVGFIGISVPSFLLALVALWIAFKQFNMSAIGLFSPEYMDAAWSWGKVVDLLKHLWIPVVIIGMAGTASLIRTMRGTLLDELRRQYVITARSKGLPEIRNLIKYPVRTAINPIISTIGWLLPGIISGEVLVSMVMNIPTTGPLLLTALLNQDMYLAGSIVLILSCLTVIGTLISDILLTWLDPRIRFESIAP
ncbi:MAG: ABC transporter permease [Caldilineaceae bacterium SB0662_bin_9]|uniref:ABC transporter permease n=1 Tax=Caldilineaceae bacterium SB0662_bin_9 TaxID=2605258 RepID=A0A6B1DW60_9CHLR|nr:ABC transporter permease [Caldilineaceae bacterium]MXZ40517.1 ABC transporter permease [Caldilineaceae bacterium SB0666_bin_21]MYD90624.1 ABC transporter permease [Caldilineaceae bacterium SB0662_bin_9]